MEGASMDGASMEGASMEGITVGGVEVRRVIEWRGPLRTVAEILPDTPAEVWQANRSWLSPDFWDPGTGAYVAAVQTWVIRSSGRTILIDTGVGNDRDRPRTPEFSQLQTDYLDRLGAAGVRPEDVDVVVNTHLHSDHVGWNTRLEAGTWVPTFPNATYLLPRADHDYFTAADASFPRLVLADSVDPVASAGRLRLWEDGLRIDDVLRLEPAPGHTPGSSVVWLESGGERAVFAGDLLHSPVQILHPRHASCFDVDLNQARVSRLRVLAEAARTGALVFPAHFGGHGGVVVKAGPEPDTFAIDHWVDV
jgi:glyoxylase-like metal-dependent hydrolase (beta-lactamase superfamily II)